MSKIIGAVEIGTSQAKALIGEVGDAGSLSIVAWPLAEMKACVRGKL